MSRTATPRDLIPETHCVLGTLLRPFSLGHHLLFDCIASPFLGAPTAAVSPEDLAIAVFICGAPYSQTAAALLRGDWSSEFSRWTARLRPRWWQPTRFIHEVESAKFSAYLTDGYRRPPVWRHQLGAGIAFSAPWECLLQCRLVSGGFALGDVLEMYLPAVWYHYHTLSEIAQADNCADAAKWRKTFYTADDEARLNPLRA